MKFLNKHKILLLFLLKFISIFTINIDINAQNFQPASVNQISFVDPRQQEYSTYFVLNGQTQGLTVPRFLNVFTKLPENPDVFDWVIQNVPLVPFPQPELMSFWFNLTYLGLENGVPVNQLFLAYFVTDTFMLMPPLEFPPSAFVPTNVSQAEYNVGNGYIGNPYDIVFFDKMPLIFNQINVQEMLENLPNLLQYRGCNVPNLDLDSSTNPPGSVLGYAGDKNACGPAAAANSMQWLETVHPEIKTNLSLREKLVELSKMMNRENNQGVSTKDFIKGKLDFIDKHKLPIKVKFQSDDIDTNNIKSPNKKYNNEAINRNANKADSTKWAATWDFLFKEVKDGEDVELLLDSYTIDDEGQIVHTGGHVVTVSGVSQIGGIKRVWVKDDANQRISGGTAQIPLTWLLVSEESGIPYLKEWSEGYDVTIVTGIVSESYDANVQFSFDPKATTIGRLSFEEPFIASNTTSGIMGFYLFESSKLKYINALARTSETQQPVWLVQNLPAMPFHKDHWVSTPVELGALNLTAGVPIQVQFITSDTNLREKPSWNVDSFFDIFYKIELSHNVPDGSPETQEFIQISDLIPPSFNGPQAARDSVYRGCTVPNIDLNNNSYPQSANWTGDLNACGPASAANSMQWLSETHPKIQQDASLREKMEELDRMMKRQNGKGVRTYDLIRGKLDFIDKYKLSIKVKFQSSWFRKDSNVASPNRQYNHIAENKNKANNAYPEWEWLVQEMKNGEDVELLYGYYDADGKRRGGHWVTVTGIMESGGEKRIWIKDDILQSGSGYGKTNDNRDSSGEEVIGWGSNRGGVPVLRRFGFDDWQLRVESLVSESYDSTVSFEPPKSSLKISLLEPGSDNFDFNPYGGYISDIYPKNNSLYYRNIVLKNPENDALDWAVRNMPVMPFDTSRTITVGINLKPLFVNDRLPDSLDFFIFDFFDTTYPKLNDIVFWYRTNIRKSKYEIGIGLIDLDTTRIYVPFLNDSIYHPVFNKTELLKDSVYIGCNMPNIDLDSTAHPATDNYAGDKNACGPAAAANSMHWLEKVHKFNTNKSLREKLEELSKYMERQKERGVTNDQMIKGKLKFIAENKLPIEVKFQSFRHTKDSVVSIKDNNGNEIKAKNKNTKDKGYPSWDWLVQEMKEGEDVELIYGRYDSTGRRLGGHVVTVTGVLDDRGARRIWFKDDTRQRTPGLRNNPDDSLETGEEVATWDTIPGGIPVITRWGSKSRRIEAIISESYVEPVPPPKPIINDIKLEKIKFDVGEGKKLDFMLLTVKFTSIDKTNYMNIVQKTNDGNFDCWWWGKNIILPKGISATYSLWITNICTIKKTGKKGDLPNENEEYEVSFVFSDSILTVLPEKDSVYKLKLTERTISSLNDLTDGALSFGFKPDELPVFFIPNNPELNYYAQGMPVIDLDSTISPTVDINYSGDYNAGNPASAATAFEWLKMNYSQIIDNTNTRTKLELLSKFMNRQKNKGSLAVDMIKGKLSLVDSLKLPISIYFQLVDYGNDSIISPNRTYGHFARNKNVMAGYPTWEFINSEIKSGRTVELMLQWIDKQGRLLGSKTCVVAGTSNANGQASIWLLEDLDHSKSGGTILSQSIFIETSTAISRSFLFDRSLGDTVCWVVGAVSQGYDQNMSFLDVQSDLNGTNDFNVAVTRNPIIMNEPVILVLNIPTDAKICIKLYNTNGEEKDVILNEWISSGRNEIELSGKLSLNLASGLYFIKADWNGRTLAVPVIILN